MGILNSLKTTAFACSTAALLLLAGCSGSSSSGTATPNPTPSTGNATLNLAITDAPSDDWQQVSVVLKSAALIPQGSSTPVTVWTAGSTPQAINLVDLNSVAKMLGTVSVNPGTYTTLQLTIDTNPATMTLVDDNGNTIPAANITVKGNGTINVDLSTPLVVAAGGTATLQADFNLADPLSIMETTVGGTTQVVLNLQVRFKALPANLRNLQFARELGVVSNPTATGFTVTTASGAAFTYLVDAGTIFVDADAKAAGTLAGVTAGKYALVASNLNADGTLYARRVWYAAAASTLPTWTPEGLVRRVRADQNFFTVFASGTNATGSTCTWGMQKVMVDANTAWTFHNTVTMGTGTAFLQDIWRGCRVDVQLDSTGTTATSVNVQSAYDEGFIGAATATGVTFGWAATPALPMAQGLRCGIDDLSGRTWTYYNNSTDTAHAFSWWYFGLPSSSETGATGVADLQTLVAASQSAKLPVAAWANLYWDTTSGSWQVYQLILEPERLHTSIITTAYTDGGSGSGTMGVTTLNPWQDFISTSTTPMTITLDYTGDLQTVVESLTYTQSTNTFAFVAPVPSTSWATLLVPPPSGTVQLDQIWVRPVLSSGAISWHAYTVKQFTVQ